MRIQSLYRPPLGETTNARGLCISVPRVVFRLAAVKGNISSTEVFNKSCYDDDDNDPDKTNNATLLNLIMKAGTFSCKQRKIKFQLIGLSTSVNPNYCPYCGNDSIDKINVTYG